MILGLDQNSLLLYLQKWQLLCNFSGCAPSPCALFLHSLITLPRYSSPLNYLVTPSLQMSWVWWAMLGLQQMLRPWLVCIPFVCLLFLSGDTNSALLWPPIPHLPQFLWTASLGLLRMCHPDSTILAHLLPLKSLAPHSLSPHLRPLPLWLDSTWPSANSNLLFLKRMSGPYIFAN